jgi:2-polyprenyl-3-methyl-5-hydroxy-6-metoxy-1,4-benzoquinol methylase
MDPYIRLPKALIVRDRQAPILARCQGKRVLHLGCADAGLLHERFEGHELVHQRLAAIAGELWGVDIDAAGISFLRSKGFDNLIVGDICELDKIKALQGKNFDVIVASEVIEHLANPGLFLNTVKALMAHETELIISVPNAFRLDTLIWLLRGVEYIHPDHNYWFSYHTITNLVRKSGFNLKKLYVYSFQYLTVVPNRVRKYTQHPAGKAVAKPGEVASTSPAPAPFLRLIVNYFRSLPKRLLVSVLYKTTPFWGDGIIIVAQRSNNQ